jgi:hypothetical protein
MTTYNHEQLQLMTMSHGHQLVRSVPNTWLCEPRKMLYLSIPLLTYKNNNLIKSFLRPSPDLQLNEFSSLLLKSELPSNPKAKSHSTVFKNPFLIYIKETVRCL